jgi:hypothetical protein
MVVLDAEVSRGMGVVGMVADDERDFAGELTHLPSGQEVVQAVRLPGDQERNPAGLI